METELEIANKKIFELEEKIKTLTSNDIAIVKIDGDILQMCIDMYKSGERLTAIKWLIEEAKRDTYTFGIKWAKEYFENIGLEKIEEV